MFPPAIALRRFSFGLVEFQGALRLGSRPSSPGRSLEHQPDAIRFDERGFSDRRTRPRSCRMGPVSDDGDRARGSTSPPHAPPRFNGAPSAMSVIDAAEAAVVRRVFRLFADGVALKKIATTLNEEGLEAPNDGGRGNKRGHGWGHTTIRAMLRNERYLGHLRGISPSGFASPGARAGGAS